MFFGHSMHFCRNIHNHVICLCAIHYVYLKYLFYFTFSLYLSFITFTMSFLFASLHNILPYSTYVDVASFTLHAPYLSVYFVFLFHSRFYMSKLPYAAFKFIRYLCHQVLSKVLYNILCCILIEVKSIAHNH